MTLIVAQVLDQVEISEASSDAIREWRSQHHDGSGAVHTLAKDMNEALGNAVDDELEQTIRRRDYYRRIQ